MNAQTRKLLDETIEVTRELNTSVGHQDHNVAAAAQLVVTGNAISLATAGIPQIFTALTTPESIAALKAYVKAMIQFGVEMDQEMTQGGTAAE